MHCQINFFIANYIKYFTNAKYIQSIKFITTLMQIYLHKIYNRQM